MAESVTPAPILTRLEGLHDGVMRLTVVLGGVPVRGRIAAADVTAGEAEAQVDPAVAGAQAFFAPLGSTQRDALVHLVVGMLLALLYAGIFVARLRGSPLVRGAIYGILVFVGAQIVFMPLVGAGVFSGGDIELLIGSLLGHLVYGAVVGWIYGLQVST